MDLSEFHFLRPWWWLAVLPLLLLAWTSARSAAQSRGWSAVIDPALLPHLIEGEATQARRVRARLPWVLAALIGIAALAGPAWERQSLPLSQSLAARVFVLDLSPSMGAADVLPNRHTRARFKLRDALERIEDGSSALVAYSGDAFVVAPLSDDVATLANFLDALDPGVMPIAGERADLALERAADLLAQAGHADGDIILISDGVGPAATRTARRLAERGYRTSVLAVGTEQGAPVADSGGRLLTDREGRIRIASIDLESLAELAAAGQGALVRMSADDSDIAMLLAAPSQARARSLDAASGASHSQWHDRGPWLALLLLPMLAWAFRRGLVYLLVLATGPVLWPAPAQAFDWSSLWSNSEQRASVAIASEDFERARSLTRDPMREGEAAFRAGDFEGAVDAFQRAQGADAHYNRGNALASLQRWDEALEAYDQALARQAGHEDALANKAAIEALKQQQQQQGEQGEQGQNQSGEQGQGQAQGAQDPSQQGSQSQSQSSESESGESQSADSSQQDGSTGNPSEAGDSGQQGEPSEQQQAAAREAAEQAHADAMSEALQQGEPQQGDAADQNMPAQMASPEQAAEQEAAQATEQWLRRIPDDPGALLRRKFLLEHRRRGNLPAPSEERQ